MNGVIETSSGDLLRKGNCDFENDGSFDSGTETYKIDIPGGLLIKKSVGGDYSNFNGSTWDLIILSAAEALETNKVIRCAEIDYKTAVLIGTGFVYDNETFSASIYAQTNWNALKNQESEFTWPLDVSTKANYKYNLAQGNVGAFWTAGKDFIKGHLDSGRNLKVGIVDATTQTELDAVVDSR